MTRCKRVPLSTLRVGTVLMAPVTDPTDSRITLLGQGVVVTRQFIDRLVARGVESVVLSQRDIALLHAFSSQGRRTKVPPAHCYVQSADRNDHSIELDKTIESSEFSSLAELGQTIATGATRPSDCAYAEGLPHQWAVQGAEQIESLEEFMSDSSDSAGDKSEIGPLWKTCCELIDCIAEDADALVCLSCTPFDCDYPSRHAVHVAGIALAVGTEMGLDRASLIDLGIGCLIHDIGMNVVGLRTFDSKETLSRRQLQQLADHPVKAVEVAGQFGDKIADASKLVAYQIHERGDGSGYPRGVIASQMHPLSKIASVADALVGMLTRRKHRMAIQGYHVMASLLNDMKAGKFDARVMRALLQSASLYPLGSYVKLNNDLIGRVIRTGGTQFVKPTVEMWHRDHVDRAPVVVNLKHESEIRITGSMPAVDHRNRTLRRVA